MSGESALGGSRQTPALSVAAPAASVAVFSGLEAPTVEVIGGIAGLSYAIADHLAS